MRVEYLLVVVLAAALVNPGIAGAGAAQETTSTPEPDCSTTVVHDAFRFDNETVADARNGSATSVSQNTRVTVSQNSVFVRIEAVNPNGYCTEFVVEIGPGVVPSSELGSLTSLDEQTSAEWHAVRDFERDETYTRVTFALPAGGNVTFAPNKARIMQLEWLADAKTESEGIISTISGYIPGTPNVLTQRTYTFGPDRHGSSIVTVPLRDPNSSRRIEDWQAVYRVGDGPWQPIGSEASAPVYYQEQEDVVQFYFNDQNAEVEFTANPGTVDRARHQYRSYTSGLGSIGDILAGDVDWFPGQAGGAVT